MFFSSASTLFRQDQDFENADVNRKFSLGRSFLFKLFSNQSTKKATEVAKEFDEFWYIKNAIKVWSHRG